MCTPTTSPPSSLLPPVWPGTFPAAPPMLPRPAAAEVAFTPAAPFTPLAPRTASAPDVPQPPAPGVHREADATLHVRTGGPAAPVVPAAKVVSSVFLPRAALPLQATGERERELAAAWLQHGNALYLPDGALKQAQPYWLEALALAPPPALAQGMLVAIDGFPREWAAPALLLLQASWMQPSAQHARHTYRTAASRLPGVHDITSSLLGAASAKGRLADVHKKLTLRYAALLPEAAKKQERMVSAVREADFFTALSLARELRKELPHLLAPRCAKFISSLALGGGTSKGGTFANTSIEKARKAAKVVAFALSRSSDGQVDAIGALTLSDHRDLWKTFLERFYEVEPAVFGAPILKGGSVAFVPVAARRVAGLPWGEALQLPLAEAWVLAADGA